jgi:hypothetical protein
MVVRNCVPTRTQMKLFCPCYNSTTLPCYNSTILLVLYITGPLMQPRTYISEWTSDSEILNHRTHSLPCLSTGIQKQSRHVSGIEFVSCAIRMLRFDALSYGMPTFQSGSFRLQIRSPAIRRPIKDRYEPDHVRFGTNRMCPRYKIAW